MADLPMSGPTERDTEQAITALKKGAYLLKYGRRGKPKFCPFRLSSDESVLIWYTGKEEKQLTLSHISRIIPGQRTLVTQNGYTFSPRTHVLLAIFQRYPRPEKEYQSFSLIYNDRTLDLICKDKDEAEVWFAGLKSLISRGNYRKWRTETQRDRTSSDTNGPSIYSQRNSPPHPPYDSSDILNKDSGDTQHAHIPYEIPASNGLGKAFSDAILYTAPQNGIFRPNSDGNSVNNSLSSVGTENLNGQARGSIVDTFRVSLSSAVSSSSQGSGHEDFDSSGDVVIWGEGTGDGVMGGGMHRTRSLSGITMDALLPKALESAVVLDVQNIACGSRHAMLVTKQGEVFSWGEEAGGRLGHGIEADVMNPKLVDALSGTNVEFVACGEYHTCAVTLSGDLYTWGDGTHNLGLLGHGSEISHWIPKKVSGQMEGIHVSSVSCGPWHTAVVTSAGQLFTFGDGTFGALGHGDRTSTSIPREVESLKGLRTTRAACGIWHTAAVVEIMSESTSSSTSLSGKLFTWGDGDKGQLGNGDNKPRLVPECVSAAVESSFCQVACGHSLTIALTTSGFVFAMGSPVYGQLGNPKADGKFPTCIEGKLHNNFVEEIACGSYHVAVLTSKADVYTWGKGANGQLGHGDIDDRNTPTPVDALKDRQVRSIVCGSSFTAAICLHKWVSTADQSTCSGCRLPFGFRRKRHNCYNCGLVFCKACSGKKSLRASMAPNINKPYRVCDDCFSKLKKSMETYPTSRFAGNRSGSASRSSYEMVEKEILDLKLHGQPVRLSSLGSFKHADSQSSKSNGKLEPNANRVSPLPNGSGQSRSLHSLGSSNSIFGSSKKIFSASVPGSRIGSRATSPVSRRASPPRSTTPTPTPIPTLAYLTSKVVVNDSKQTNDALGQEVIKLRVQVEDLTHKSELLEVELARTSKQLKEAIAMAGEESAKCKAAKEVIKSLTTQLKEVAERLPEEAVRSDKSDYVSSQTSNDPIPASNENRSSSVPSLQEPNSDGHPSNPTLSNGNNRLAEGTEWVAHDEPGVYITLTSLPGGETDLKRVRFSRKRFSEKQAENWWAENRARVCEKYNILIVERSSTGSPSALDGEMDS